MRAEDWTPDELRRALTYGFCLVCMTPHEVRTTETESDGRRTRHAEMVRPCGHTTEDVDRELERMA